MDAWYHRQSYLGSGWTRLTFEGKMQNARTYAKAGLERRSNGEHWDTLLARRAEHLLDVKSTVQGLSRLQPLSLGSGKDVFERFTDEADLGALITEVTTVAPSVAKRLEPPPPIFVEKLHLAHHTWLSAAFLAETIAKQPKLQHLSLKECDVPNEVLELLCQRCPELMYLDLGRCDASGVPPLASLRPVAKLTKLQFLGWSGQTVSAEELGHIAKVPLTGLDLGSCDCDDAAVQALRPLRCLRTLVLTGATVGAEGLKVIATLSCIEVLDLGHCRCTAEDGAVSVVGSLKRLKKLDLGGLPSGRLTVRGLKKCRFLAWLSLARSAVEGEDLKQLLASVPLEYLDLTATDLGDQQILDAGRRCPTLQTLHVSLVPLAADFEQQAQAVLPGVKVLRHTASFVSPDELNLRMPALGTSGQKEKKKKGGKKKK
jgi:hypothetical protein